MRRSKFVVLGIVAGLFGGAALASGVSAPAASSTVRAHRAAFSLHQVIGASLLKGPAAYDIPDAIAMAPQSDGRIFIAQQSGRVLVFHGLHDTAPKLVINLSNDVFANGDRGLLGLAVDPHFPSSPYIYVMYARNSKTKGGPVPGWPNDACSQSSPSGGGCLTYNRIERITLSGDKAVARKTLIDDWCTQFNHAGAGLRFGPDGYLYASSGDGATRQPIHTPDYGQYGNPKNPCGDPPAGVGGDETPPTTEGGSLRAQDVRTTGDPTGLNGSIIRVVPSTGAGAPGNPFASSSDANARRIIAYGLRNPFRITFRPGTNEIYAADAGWENFEEVDRVKNSSDTVAENFGWPCYEGAARQQYWDALNVNLCETLYAKQGQAGGATMPSFSYPDHGHVISSDGCTEGAKGTAITGIAFYQGSSYPANLHNAFFFTDVGRTCIWAAPAGTGGVPNFANRVLVTKLPDKQFGITDIATAPNGDLLLVNIYQQTLLELQYS